MTKDKAVHFDFKNYLHKHGLDLINYKELNNHFVKIGDKIILANRTNAYKIVNLFKKLEEEI